MGSGRGAYSREKWEKLLLSPRLHLESDVGGRNEPRRERSHWQLEQQRQLLGPRLEAYFHAAKRKTERKERKREMNLLVVTNLPLLLDVNP